MDGVDDLGVVDTAQVRRCDPEVRVPELPLDHQRDPLARHLDGMSMAELMRREPAPDSGRPGGAAQLHANPGGGASAAARGAMEHAEQSADREEGANLEPRLKVLSGPAVAARPEVLSARLANGQRLAISPEAVSAKQLDQALG